MKIAFVIPIIPKHYHMIYHFIDKMIKVNYVIDIFLIFSNESDYISFSKKDYIQHIIIRHEIITHNIVTYKKFYALKYFLMNNDKYDYFIVCDAEIDIIEECFNEECISKKVIHFFEKKKLFGGCVQNNSGVENIIKNSCELFNNTESIYHLNRLTCNYRLLLFSQKYSKFQKNIHYKFIFIMNK